MSETPRQTRSPKKAANASLPETPENGGAEKALPVYGSIDPQANQTILQMRERSGQIINELGRMEVRKFQLIRQLNQMEAQTQALLKNEAQNLGIPDGTPWQLTPEGMALGVP